MTGKHKITRKAVTLFMAIVMVFTTLAVPSMAKSKVKLSKTKLTITSGKSTTIKLSGTSKKAKWSVSGKKLVTIKTKGTKKHKATIKAGKKTGKCTVKVKFGKKTLKCTVTVKAKKKPAPEFKENPLSGTAKERTAEFTARTVTGKETDAAFRTAMTDTSLKLLKYLIANEQDKSRNVLISPDSILTAMAMVENGAAGNTLTQMQTAFGGVGLDDFDAYLYTLNKRITSSESVKYHLADSIWYKEKELSVKDAFLQKNVDFFKSQVFEAPFSDATLSDINNWVYNNTRGMIPNVLDNLSEDTVMLLINAIAFEGRWAEEYYRTTSMPFRDDQGATKNANMLLGTEETYVKIGGANGFVKPYLGNEIAFLGIETPEGMTVDEFVQTLTAEDFVNGYNNKTDEYVVHTRMPEFKYDYDASLVDSLKSLGITDAFDDKIADFSDIATLMPNENLFISDVIHKTHIELDKEGTKAAAVTAVVMEKASIAHPTKPQIDVNLDHPFVYAIIDVQSGIPLFIGTVKTI